MLNYVKPHIVHVFVDGKVAKTGGNELVVKLESKGDGDFLSAKTECETWLQ